MKHKMLYYNSNKDTNMVEIMIYIDDEMMYSYSYIPYTLISKVFTHITLLEKCDIE